VASDGGIFTYGDAVFAGSMGGKHLNQPMVGMAVDNATGGYWTVASDGGIFSFGNVQFYGSMGGKPLNQPITEMEATLQGNGYRMVASDGGVFSSFGNAPFEGSVPGLGIHINDVVGMAAHLNDGYWVVDANGNVYAFGSAQVFAFSGAVL
jgi:hypothetical protein